MKIARVVVPAVIGWVGAVSYWIGVGPEEVPSATADTAMVLGAAVDDHMPSPVFRERIAHAIDLYKAGRVDHLLFTGGKADGDRLAESEAARSFAIAEGVPAEAIEIETRSATTMQNLEQAQRVMAAKGFADAIIVSDPLHMRRAMEMAESIGMDAQPSATTSSRYRSLSTQAPFLMREAWYMHVFWLSGE